MKIYMLYRPWSFVTLFKVSCHTKQNFTSNAIAKINKIFLNHVFEQNLFFTIKVKNKKSKEFYCRCYAVKLCLFFSVFIFSPFQCTSCTSCHVKNFYYSLGDLHLPVDSFSILTRTLYKTWKSHYRQLQVPILIFN